MNRREFLQCAAVLITGATASQLGFTLSEEQTVYLANAPDYNTTEVNFFTPDQRKTVAAMCETIIPRTETPGAIDAGVPQFFELMVADWLNDEERAIVVAGLQDIEDRIPLEYGKPYSQLAPEQQVQILEALEDAASDSAWYDFGNIQQTYMSDAPFICQLKELTIWGFFTSEEGGSQVLRYNPMPMYFDGDIPLSPDESSWANSF